MKRLLLLASAAVALAAASLLNLRLSEGALARPYDVEWVPAGRAARVAALGHRTFLSDLYWLATVQYIGEPQSDVRGHDKLFALVDLVTDLDPRHGYAYQTGGVVLSAVGRLDESNRILEKGMRHGPPYWTFPYYLSFNHWFYLGDYETAAHWARVAARTPGASPNVSHLAVSLSSKTGTAEDAIAMLEELQATVKDEVTASRLEEQKRLAVVERDAQRLEAAAERFRAERGRDVSRLAELVEAGYVAAIPRDPFGGAYEWMAAERKVRSSANPFRFEIREGPQRRPYVVDPLKPVPIGRSE